MLKPSAFLLFDMWIEGCTTSFRMFETMAAVPAVVNARMPMIWAAACNPLAGNWPELYKMVAEKADAFTQAGLSITRDMQAVQAEMLKPTRSAKRSAAASARIHQHALGAVGRALAPVHAAATGNAKRLGRGKRG